MSNTNKEREAAYDPFLDAPSDEGVRSDEPSDSDVLSYSDDHGVSLAEAALALTPALKELRHQLTEWERAGEKLAAQRDSLRAALVDIEAMTFDPWSNGARAKEIARAVLALAPGISGWVSDELEEFLKAQDALDNHELNGQNGVDYFTLVRRRNAARKDLDAVLSTAPGIAPHQPQPEGKPWDMKTAHEKAPELIAQLDEESERLTRYGGSGDALLNEAARVIEALTQPQPEPTSKGEPVSEEIAAMLGERVAFLRDPAVYRGKYWDSMTNEQRKQAFTKLDGGAAGYAKKFWTWRHFDMAAEDIGMSSQQREPQEAGKVEAVADERQPSDGDYLRWAEQAGAKVNWDFESASSARVVFLTASQWGRFCDKVRALYLHPSQPEPTSKGEA